MSPQSEDVGPAASADVSEYSAQERTCLLRLAHQSIEAALENRSIDLAAPNEHLAELRGAFVTLHLNRRLRGCIGYVFPTQSLYRTVAEAARAAAFDDPRFDPVTASEATVLRIEISVLSRLQPITPEAVVVGKHGLVVSQGNRRGLLLPQVPVEWNWDRQTFLTQTCLKAGLAPDACLQDIELQSFTAEVFGEI
jgi:AmmeMemoRadiSam system protein A